MRSGFVGLVGRPNVGKSTLMNEMVGSKIAITSNKPQTTRNLIQGIYNDSDTQIIFVDTPGIHKPNHKLGTVLNKQAYYSMDDVDVILFLVDASVPFGKGDQFILERLKETNKPILLILNKIDQMTNEQILMKLEECRHYYDFAEIVPVSALKHRNVDHLVEVIRPYLTDEVRYYGENQVTNHPLTFTIAELVREKVFQLTEEEVPHSLTCVVESIEKGKTSSTIHVAIIVDRESLKKIIIGAHGSKIKEIGTRARKDIEELLGTKIYLELFVKVIPKWRDREKYLMEFGFHDFEQ